MSNMIDVKPAHSMDKRHKVTLHIDPTEVNTLALLSLVQTLIKVTDSDVVAIESSGLGGPLADQLHYQSRFEDYVIVEYHKVVGGTTKQALKVGREMQDS